MNFEDLKQRYDEIKDFRAVVLKNTERHSGTSRERFENVNALPGLSDWDLIALVAGEPRPLGGHVTRHSNGTATVDWYTD